MRKSVVESFANIKSFTSITFNCIGVEIHSIGSNEGDLVHVFGYQQYLLKGCTRRCNSLAVLDKKRLNLILRHMLRRHFIAAQRLKQQNHAFFED